MLQKTCYFPLCAIPKGWGFFAGDGGGLKLVKNCVPRLFQGNLQKHKHKS